MPTEVSAQLRKAFAELSGDTDGALLLSDALRQHLDDRQDLSASSLESRARAVSEFQRWLQTNAPVRELTVDHAIRYVREDVVRRSQAVSTMKQHLAQLASFWAYLCDDINAVQTNIFRGRQKLLRAVKTSSKPANGANRAWTDAELVRGAGREQRRPPRRAMAMSPL